MKGTHLTLDDRKFIQHGLEAEKSKSQIARDLGKSPSTISKEVKLHRKIRTKNVFNAGVGYFCENRGRSKDCYGCKKSAASMRSAHVNAENALVFATNVLRQATAILTNTSTLLLKLIRITCMHCVIREKA